MKESLQVIKWVGILGIVALIALGLLLRSCGTETEVTCPSGASAHIIERGHVGGGGVESKGVCEIIEGKGS